MSKQTKVVEVYRASGEAEAHIVMGLLESHGIYCLLQSNAAPSVHVFAVDGMGEVKVMVDASLAEKAKGLINGVGHA